MIQKRIIEREPRLAEMVDGFMECALWASTDCDGEPLDRQYCAEDFSECAVEAIVRECREFLALHESQFEDKESHAGHDFFLTRNGHGAGFWDGGWDEGDALTEACKPFGSFDVYVGDDGKLYAFGYERGEA